MTEWDIHRYCDLGNIRALRKAAEAGADLNAKNKSGATPLQTAIAHKQLASVKVLLELGADVAVQDADGSTALHYAVEHNLPEILKLLVQRCREAISISDKHGNQPLWTAAFNARGHYELVELLLQNGADPQHRNNVNLSPLDIPKRTNEAALLQMLENHLREKS